MSIYKLINIFALYGFFSVNVSANQLVIEHIANAGLKLSSGGKTVLIDAIFGPHDRFNSLNDNEFLELVNQGADAVLVSHIHDDHFEQSRSVQFLTSNPGTLFLAPPQTAHSVKANIEHSRLRDPELKNYESRPYVNNGVKIVALNFPHMSPELTADIQNFAYIVEIEGWKVLHIGDGGINAEVIAGLNLAEQEIDIALLHDLCPEQEDCVERIKQIGATHVAFYHMTDDRVEPVGKWIKQNYPSAKMLVTGFETLVLNH
ncbi:MAG: hypothetical protein Alis3KO_16310 [Aliiglaciecola sp.]